MRRRARQASAARVHGSSAGCRPKRRCCPRRRCRPAVCPARTVGGAAQRSLKFIAAAEAPRAGVVAGLRRCSRGGRQATWAARRPHASVASFGQALLHHQEARPSRPAQPSPAPRARLDHQLSALAGHGTRHARPRHAAVLRLGARLAPAVILPLAFRGRGQRARAVRARAAVLAAAGWPLSAERHQRRQLPLTLAEHSGPNAPRNLRPSANLQTPWPCRLSPRHAPGQRAGAGSRSGWWSKRWRRPWAAAPQLAHSAHCAAGALSHLP